MIFKIAWRNIWRSKLRSFTVMGSVIIGVWSLSFMLAFFAGFIEAYVRSAIENDLSHIQLHHPDFKKDKEVQYRLQDIEAIEKQLTSLDAVKAYTVRSLNNGMLATAKGSRGIQIRGVLSEKEAAITNLDQKITAGVYFDATKKRNPILVSKRLAEKLNLSVKSKVVLTFQQVNGELTSAAFKVIGLYQTGNAIFENLNVYIRQKDLSRLMGETAMIHEIAVLLNNKDAIESTQHFLSQHNDSTQVLVENYQQISPEVNLYESQMSVATYVMIVIIMLALIFGIINTMLMAVLERTRELGMLMAVGMNRSRVFIMIILETILLGVIAAPIGLLLGFLTNAYFASYGIDLSSYSEGMEKFGLSDVVYTHMQSTDYISIMIAVAITAILGALYPALKAIRLKPVDAIRKV